MKRANSWPEFLARIPGPNSWPEFLAVVGGQGVTAAPRDAAEGADGLLGEGGSPLIRKLGGEQVAALALDVRGNATASLGALHGVGLPVAEAAARLDDIGPQRDAERARDTPPSGAVTLLAPALAVRPAQVVVERATRGRVVVGPLGRPTGRRSRR